MFKQELLLLGKSPICNTIPTANRRSASVKIDNDPLYDPYIPREKAAFYSCSSLECEPLILYSITQLTSPRLKLKTCFIQSKYECETFRYNYLKNIDKLQFLSKNIRNKSFYLVDCLVYTDGGRVCHKKDDVDSYVKLVNAGSIARPNEPNVLSQDEFICEESPDKQVNCDLNPFIPSNDGLIYRSSVKIIGDVFLKSGNNVANLKYNCNDSWCGYSGIISLPPSPEPPLPPKKSPSRRSDTARYPPDPAEGKVYRCFYANKQQICKVCVCSALAALDGYSPQQDPDQFHIQTDEDDERYFLYQTHNGQYRKERRLKDGSVVGTTGWVGADGYLRLQDYIADDQGYRIYKSKTVYVGQNRPIGESLKIAKTAPTDSGYGVTPAPVEHHAHVPPRVSTAAAPVPPSSTFEPLRRFPTEVHVTPPPPSYPTSTSTPQVHVSPNSIDSSTKFDFKPTVPPITASEATPSPSLYDYDSSNANTIDDGYYASDSRRYDVFNPNSYRHADDWLRRQRPGVRLGDGYTPQFPGYDGVAFRENGFRYYLPKQYHEEATGAASERTGSFGYVDPFGIRRVIYYNTAPGEGFQIRKNNRFVGHDGTPYDPRPID